MKFLIAIEPGTVTTAYGVVVPDLPGCFSAGDTLEEAFDNAREAIDAHCEVLAEDGQDVPLPAAMAPPQQIFLNRSRSKVGAPSKRRPQGFSMLLSQAVIPLKPKPCSMISPKPICKQP